MKTQLLCTFTVNDSLSLTIDYISTYFKISNNKLYLYCDRDNPQSLILVYNIENNLRDGLAKNTILINRKKQSNTLYTINALNSLIKSINNGVLDKNLQIDWDNYKDKLLIIKKTSSDFENEEVLEDGLVLINLDFKKSIYI